MIAKELRIGNLVYLKSKEKIYQIDSGHDIEEIDDAPEMFDATPIILTDEWFQKFEQFYKNEEYWCIDINDYKYCFKYRDWAENWAFYQEFTDSPHEHDNGVKYPISFDIKHVHQLQNLYFALQHEELKLNGK
jgi:hypothetical protein